MKPYGMDDAEAELRAAIDADDLPAIRRLEKVIDDLDVHPAPVGLHAAALWYAEQGLHVFPLRVGSKYPLPKCQACKDSDCTGPDLCGHELCHGLKDATTDTDEISRWWQRMPKANIGIATGHLVDVVDIDGLEGVIALAGQIEDVRDRSVGMVSTPRPGGQHWYIPHVEGRANKAGLLDHVDTRGVGGYCVVPPSRTEVGDYTWIRPLDLNATERAS